MQIDLAKYRAKADQKYGNNQRGQYLFWSNQALRAFPSSPVQKAFQAEAEKYRAAYAERPL